MYLSIQVPHPEETTRPFLPNIITSASRFGHPSPRPARSPPGSSGHGKNQKYRGIRRRNGKWVSEIREPGKSKRIWLGTFPTEEAAAAAYDAAALALKGPDTALNFPESIESYPIPDSTSASDICAAAAIAAEARILMKAESEESEDTAGRSSEAEEFVDMESVLNMPNLLVYMAEGMLLSPPRFESRSSDELPNDSDGAGLWSYT